jgi:signal transduction histidine kinase
MKKKKYRKYVLLGVFYLIGLIAGIMLMLAIPYVRHESILLDMAEHAASSYASEQDFGITADFGISYFAYDLDGNCMDRVISGFHNDIYELHLEEDLEYVKNEKALLHYEQITLRSSISETTISQLLSLVAIVPIRKDGTVIGGLFLVRGLEDLPGNIHGFIIIWSIVFALLFVFFFILDRQQAKLDEIQRTYIASMNHELKSPITSIKALSETLLDGYINDPEKQFFYYSTILKEADNLETTVLEILELSKLQSTKNLYKKETCSAEAAFGSILERYTSLCEDIDLEFHAPDLTATSLPVLYTVPNLVSRVLDLLLHNAVKFTEAEGGRIDVTFHTERNHLRVDVRDNGVGISPDDLPHIFDRFYQSEKAHNSQGSGLGLSIVREILNGLKETIHVESTPGSGTVFSFTISIRHH